MTITSKLEADTQRVQERNEPYPAVYYCKRCDRYTDVRYLHDKKGDRYKSYCYNCGDEMLIAVEVHKRGDCISRQSIRDDMEKCEVEIRCKVIDRRFANGEFEICKEQESCEKCPMKVRKCNTIKDKDHKCEGCKALLGLLSEDSFPAGKRLTHDKESG